MVRVSKCKCLVATVYESWILIQKTEMFISQEKELVSKLSLGALGLGDILAYF